MADLRYRYAVATWTGFPGDVVSWMSYQGAPGEHPTHLATGAFGSTNLGSAVLVRTVVAVLVGIPADAVAVVEVARE